MSEWLFKNKVPISWLAKNIGVSKQTIHNWITGKHSLTDKHRESLKTITSGQVDAIKDDRISIRP